MQYPATFEPTPEGGFVVTFRDITEAITQGENEAEACAMAQDALVAALDFYFESGRPVPAPSETLVGDVLVALPADVCEKVIEHNAEAHAKDADKWETGELGQNPDTVERDDAELEAEINKHVGSDLEDFLKEEGIADEISAAVRDRVARGDLPDVRRVG